MFTDTKFQARDLPGTCVHSCETVGRPWDGAASLTGFLRWPLASRALPLPAALGSPPLTGLLDQQENHHLAPLQSHSFVL